MDNNNRYNKHTAETRDESKSDDDEEEKTKYTQQDEKATTSWASVVDSETEKQEDTEDDEDDSLHAVSSVKEMKRATELVILEEGTHTTATETESRETVPEIGKHISFEQIIEEVAMPAPSTSKVVENVREYVKQIESRIEDDVESAQPRCSTTSPQPSAAQIVEPIKEALMLETIKGTSELSFTSRQSDASLSQLSEVERIAHDEVERIVAENEEATALCANERPDFQQVERENQEIAERFKQIMEMFDSFTKNLESLEMPALSKPTEEVTERAILPLRRRLSFKGLRGAEMNAAGGGASACSGSGFNEFYLEVHGERKTDGDVETDKETSVAHELAPKSYNTPCSSVYPQKVEAALDPMYRDIATTVSGLELLTELPTPNSAKYRQYARDVQNLNTIGCQTTGDYYSMQASTSASTSFSNFHAITKDYTQTDDDVVNALIIDSVTDASTSAYADAVTTSFTDTNTETSNITVVQPRTNIHGTTDQSALVKIREPPTIIDFTQDTSAPRVTTVLNDAAAGVTDAPCERTYHTIHIEANSSPASSEMRRPPLCSRLWNVITDFCAAVCLCLQVNKDCLFCLGFFIAFVVSASFLTAFFYRTLSINPQLLQASAAPSNVAQRATSLQRNENSAYGL